MLFVCRTEVGNYVLFIVENIPETCNHDKED